MPVYRKKGRKKDRVTGKERFKNEWDIHNGNKIMKIMLSETNTIPLGIFPAKWMSTMYRELLEFWGIWEWNDHEAYP